MGILEWVLKKQDNKILDMAGSALRNVARSVESDKRFAEMMRQSVEDIFRRFYQNCTPHSAFMKTSAMVGCADPDNLADIAFEIAKTSPELQRCGLVCDALAAELVAYWIKVCLIYRRNDPAGPNPARSIKAFYFVFFNDLLSASSEGNLTE